jgi:hypothetical protein
LLTLGVGLCGAAAASADSTTSSNWAGYAAHRGGVNFKSVTAQWVIPRANCTAGITGYSSAWVGLGGYSESSNALEQTGTEVDCRRSGESIYFAWYELVPSPSHPIFLSVRPGDLMKATVSASGHLVTIALADLSNHRSFRRTIYASQVDTTSAEWIVEAPSDCTSSSDCQSLPLADFGSTSFSSAGATTLNGHTGAIRSPWWATTEIKLVPRAARFVSGVIAGAAGEAVPSTLSSSGAAFTVNYEASAQSPGPAGPPTPSFATRASSTATGLVHTGR